MRLDNIAVSPCSNPEMDIDAVLAAYGQIGFRQFEVFTSWVHSAFDYTADPKSYVAKGKEHGIRFHSFHLPLINGQQLDETLAEAIKAAEFSSAIGANVILYKASDRQTYIKAASPFLDAIEKIEVTPVIQNHFGTPLTTLADVGEVIEGINDSRMKSLLEVGHFHSAGVSWRDAHDLLGNSIALLHIKDQIGKQSVAFGTGEIDMPGLFLFMDSLGYEGGYVVEMEVKDRENTLMYLKDALGYVKQFCEVNER